MSVCFVFILQLTPHRGAVVHACVKVQVMVVFTVTKELLYLLRRVSVYVSGVNKSRVTA